MKQNPSSISDLIARWKTISDFSTAIDCGYEAARQMRNRGRITPEHWPKVIKASAEIGIAGVNYEWLASQWAAPKPISRTEKAGAA